MLIESRPTVELAVELEIQHIPLYRWEPIANAITDTYNLPNELRHTDLLYRL